jgi:predicted permease
MNLRSGSMGSLVLDLRAAVRGLLRDRSVTVLAILCLATGVGVSGAMLGLLDALWLRPPSQVERPESLRRVYLAQPSTGGSSSTTSYPVLRDFGRVGAFSAVGAFFATEDSLGRGAEARKVRTVLVTPAFLQLLGVRPVLGRLFAGAEGEPGRPGFAVLLGYDLWRQGFGGAPDVLGRQVVLGGESYEIVGVLPKRFTGVDLDTVDLWLPMNAAARILGPRWAENRGNRFLDIVARLRPGISQAAASEEATTLFRAAAARSDRPEPLTRVGLAPIQRAQGPDAPAVLKVAFWLAGLSWIVLSISCANVASLLVLRGIDRRREIGLRLALGAGSGRLARLMLFEGLALAALGGAAGLGLCRWMGAFLQRLLLPETQAPLVTLDARTLAIVGLLVIAAAAFSGAAPALGAASRSRSGLIAALRTGARERSPGRSRLDLALSASQIALTLALLAGAGEFGLSLYKILHLELGIDTDRVLVAAVDLESAGYPPARVDEIFRGAAERVRSLPGVRLASVGATIPFATSVATILEVPGLERLPELESGGPYVNAVSESFFATTGTRILRGRAFTLHDRKAGLPVAIVNQTMARVLWPGRDALGQCLKVGGSASPCSQVVGVVQDARRSGFQESPSMQYYVPLDQAPPSLTSRALFIRCAGDPRALPGLVRHQMLSLAPDLPFVDVRPLSDLMAPQLRPWRTGTAILSLFGVLALGLALAGLYGVVAHAMARRSYEMGVRIALGAPRRNLLWLALRHGLRIGGIGAAAGLALVIGASRHLQPLLFQVSAKDPWVLTGATVLVLGLALLASYLPGRRLQRLDPAKTLGAA